MAWWLSWAAPSTPGIGWAMGQERIVMLLEKQGRRAVAGSAAGLSGAGRGADRDCQAFNWRSSCATHGRICRLQINLGGGSFKTQFKRADKSGAQFALVLGDDEVARGVVALKALAPGIGAGGMPGGPNQ